MASSFGLVRVCSRNDRSNASRPLSLEPLGPRIDIMPMQIVVNDQPREEPAETTIAQLLARLELPLRGIAVELNGQIVPRGQHGDQSLQDGDRVEIVSFVGGG